MTRAESPDPMVASRPERSIRVLLALVVSLLTLLIFLPALDGQFLAWDDDTMLARNHAYRGLGWPQVRWMVSTTLLGHYMPLTWMSFGLSYLVGGMDPWGYHLASALLHAVNAALLTCLAWTLLRAAFAGPRVSDRPGRDALPPAAMGLGAAVAALAWSVHPLRAEPVAWATDRGDLLSGTFSLVAVLAYVRGADAPDGFTWRPWGWLALAAYAAALLSKETAVTLPVALLVLDAYPLRRSAPWRRLVREKAPFFALAATGAAVAIAARSIGARFSTAEEYGLSGRIAMVGHSLWHYLTVALFPLDLAPYHEPPLRIDLFAPVFLVPLFGTALVTVVAVAGRRRHPAVLAAWTWYGLSLLPVAGIVHSGSHLVAERYSYLPTVGFALLLGGAVVAAVHGWRTSPTRRLGGGALIAAIAVALPTWGVLAWHHSGSWRDTVTMWTVSAEADPDCRLCAVNLAAAYVNANQPAEAERWARRAVDLWPGRGRPRHLLGAALLLQGRDAEAERELVEAVRAAPGLGEAHRELGRLYDRTGRPDAAAAAFRRALAAGSPAAETQALLADVLKRAAARQER
jgi:tetratricopeptide (TPR) repeat protein